MSFWSVLGNVGKGLIGLGGGADANKIADSVLSKLGAVTSGAAKGSADQRLREADPLLRQQQLLQQGARDQFTAGLQSAQFERENQDRARKQQVLMSLLNNTQDANIQPGNPAIAARMGASTGGARPSNLTNNREALMALLGQAGPSAPTYQAPPAMSLPRAGVGEKILGGVGLTTNILGALGGLFGNRDEDEDEDVNSITDRLARLGISPFGGR